MNLINDVDFLWIAYGYKSGSLFTYLPNTASSDLITYRSTSGSRITSGGLFNFVAPHVPRLDFATTSSCPTLRLESARTNYVYSSDLLQSGAWGSGSLVCYTTNSVVAPIGTSNTSLFLETGGTGFKYINQVPSGMVSGSTMTVSFFARRYGNSSRNIGITTQNAYSASVYFILEGTGSWYAEGATNYKTNSGYVSGAMVEQLNDNWYRCSTTVYNGTYTGYSSNYRLCFVSGNSITAATRYDVATPSPVYYTSDTNSGLYICGAQAESGSAGHPTRPLPYSVSNSLVSSYISSSMGTLGTRAADRLIAIPTSSSPTNFTFYTILKTAADDTGGHNVALQSGSSIYTDFYYVGWTKGNLPIWNTGSGPTGDRNDLQGVTPNLLAANVEHKLAIRYSASLATWFRDGVMLGSQSFPLATPVWNYFNIGGLGSNVFDVSLPYTNYFRTVAVFKRGLTDAEAIALTT